MMITEIEKIESWLDDHPDFVHDYFVRKASPQMIDSWLQSRSAPQGNAPENSSLTSSRCSNVTTPVRKISAHDFENNSLLRPILNTTVDGIPTFLSLSLQGDVLPHCNSHVSRKSRQKLREFDERELIFELVKDLCNELEIRSFCHKILQNISILTDADRCSQFLVRGEKGDLNRCLVSQLFDVSCNSTMEQMHQKEEIRIPWGTGIVGYVAENRKSLNIPDCYQDDRFNSQVDKKTGYTTRNMLCMPILDVEGDVKGVAQILNKCGGKEPFTVADEKVFSRYLQFCGIGLRNAELYERSELENKLNQVLLDLARTVFEEQSSIEHIVYRVMTHTQSLLQCERCQVLLVDENTKMFSRVFDLDVNDMHAEDAGSRKSPFEDRFSINDGITGYVAMTGEILNIPDVLQDKRCDPPMNGCGNFRHYSLLCMPIRTACNKIVGVIQLINKLSGIPFNKNDEHLFEAFVIFCGMGIQITKLYERAMKAIAKTNVTLEVLSYHASATIQEANSLSKCIIPSTHTYRLQDLKFNDFSLDDEAMLKACLRMFMHLKLIERFRINYDVLCRWLLSVKKNYRPLSYHNWRHAFNVSQMMFACLTITRLQHEFGEVETLALFIACLCHDLDHRGTNNLFQIKSVSTLAQLYTTSTMEHHHFDQCIMILNSEGNQILSNLSPDEYSTVTHVLEDAILATDLAVYFRRRNAFFNMVNSGKYNWRREDNRELLRGMLMTICDIAAVTKPWKIQKVVAELIASEFFQQGDIEREQLKIQPMDMMNREKKDELPMMQVQFIDSICVPVYEAFAKISDKLQPLLNGVKQNRKQWLKLAEARNLCNCQAK